jgi:hypothetical protein
MQPGGKNLPYVVPMQTARKSQEPVDGSLSVCITVSAIAGKYVKNVKPSL